MRDVPRVAIVITSFNDGRFLTESVGSAFDVQAFSNGEADVSIVVADDGSTERRTVDVLDRLERTGVKVVRGVHGGPGSIRNAALGLVEADWFIPLDSDNRLSPSILRDLMPSRPESGRTGAIYGDAMRFGEAHGRWKMGPTDSEKLRLENHIDSCALVNRAAWASVGGYTESDWGLEDWDLWLRFLGIGLDLVYVPTVAFHYRVRSDSLIHSRGARRGVFNRPRLGVSTATRYQS